MPQQLIPYQKFLHALCIEPDQLIPIFPSYLPIDPSEPLHVKIKSTIF